MENTERSLYAALQGLLHLQKEYSRANDAAGRDGIQLEVERLKKKIDSFESVKRAYLAHLERLNQSGGKKNGSRKTGN